MNKRDYTEGYADGVLTLQAMLRLHKVDIGSKGRAIVEALVDAAKAEVPEICISENFINDLVTRTAPKAAN